jgi:SpoVK/Ycf46/Vps4 family AAA+-type ATPase
MANVGGLAALKDWITMRRECFSQEAQEAGVDTPKGMALIGPPGTGKSLVAKAVAHSLGLPLIKFDVSRVFNSLVGSSEARVRSALKMIDAMPRASRS